MKRLFYIIYHQHICTVNPHVAEALKQQRLYSQSDILYYSIVYYIIIDYMILYHSIVAEAPERQRLYGQ